MSSVKHIIPTCLIGFFIANYAWSGIAVINSLTHEYTVQAGSKYEGNIIVENTSDEDQDVRVYQHDYVFSVEEGSVYRNPGSIEKSNAEWMDYSPQFFRVPAHERSTIAYQIQIPSDDELTGTYWSILMVEVVDPIEPTDETKFLNVRTVLRYAIQMITHIEYTGKQELKFLNTDMSDQDSLRTLNVDIENTGNRAVRPDIFLQIYDESGTDAGIFKTIKKRLYPGTSARYQIKLNGLDAGTYKALLIADCGDEDVFGINFTLVVQ